MTTARLDNVNGQALVLGGSMAGMLAARVLADRYERVTVVERDHLPAGERHRRGVPQGHHFHTVLLRGTQVLESLFPGLADDLVAEGALRSNLSLDARIILSGHELRRVDAGNTIQVSRPLLENRVRARLSGFPHVKIVDGCAAGAPVTAGGRVTGVHLASGEVLAADLVVDAMGRAGRASTWLSQLGYTAPAEERIKADIAYTSRVMRIPERVRPREKMVLVGAVPGRPNGFVLAAIEDDQWIITVFGLAGDHPPMDDPGLLEFLVPATPPDVHAALRAATPVGGLHRHRFPASVWRHYERLRRFPPGLLAFGDSICSFNPIYGQGMSVAAREADVLRQCLTAGDHDLARRFYRGAAKAIAPAWQLNALGDLALPEVEGHRPVSVRVLNRYVARVYRVAAHDPVVAGALMLVAGLRADPSALMSPRVLTRVVLG